MTVDEMKAESKSVGVREIGDCCQIAKRYEPIHPSQAFGGTNEGFMSRVGGKGPAVVVDDNGKVHYKYIPTLLHDRHLGGVGD